MVSVPSILNADSCGVYAVSIDGMLIRGTSPPELLESALCGDNTGVGFHSNLPIYQIWSSDSASSQRASQLWTDIDGKRLHKNPSLEIYKFASFCYGTYVDHSMFNVHDHYPS